MALKLYEVFRANLAYVRDQITKIVRDIDLRLNTLETQPSGGVSLAYLFDTALSGDPLTGHIATDNTDPLLVTQVRIHRVTDNGQDVAIFIQTLDNGSLIGIFELAVPNATSYYEVQAVPVLVGDYFEITVVNTTFTGQAVPAVDDAPVNVQLVANYDALMPSGGTPPEVLKKASSGDYDAIWEQVDHTELTGITTDDHHPQVHSHDGGDGSGTVAHDDTTGITPDNHHNQVHLLYGTDHSDINSVPPELIRQVLAYDGAQYTLDYRLNWRNQWVAATYEKGDVVIDGAYLATANKQTQDRAAPQDVGNPAWDVPDAPVWTTFQNTSLIGSGHSYLFSETVYVNSVRVWIPVVGAGIFYRLTSLTAGKYSSVDLLGMNAGEWNIVAVNPTLVLVGTEILWYLESSNTGGSTQVTGGWTRETNSQTLEPANQSWNMNNARDTLRIDFDVESLTR